MLFAGFVYYIKRGCKNDHGSKQFMLLNLTGFYYEIHETAFHEIMIFKLRLGASIGHHVCLSVGLSNEILKHFITSNLL